MRHTAVPTPDARTKRLVLKVRDKIGRMQRELREWSGKEPTLVRVRHKDYLILKEVGWIDDNGKLSGTMLEVKPG